MDTGASCNVISETDLRRINYDFKKIQKTNSSLKTYDGTRLNVLGKVMIPCERNNQ